MLDEQRERVRELNDLEIGVDGFVREQIEFVRFAARVAEFLQAFAIRLGAFFGRTEQRARGGKGIAHEGVTALEQTVILVDLRLRADRVRDGVVGGENVAGMGTIPHLLLEGFFLRRLGGENRSGIKSILAAIIDFARILHADEIVLRPARVLLAAITPGAQRDFEALDARDDIWVLRVAQKFQLRHRELSVGAARMARDKREVALLRAVLGPFDIVLNLRRLVILVHAKETHIEAVPGKLEVVRIAAEKGDLLLGREYEADVCILLESIYVVRAAL